LPLYLRGHAAPDADIYRYIYTSIYPLSIYVFIYSLLYLISYIYISSDTSSEQSRAFKIKMRTSTRVLLFLFLVWLVAGAIMSFSLTPDMAQAFKQRYKVDPSKVYQIVGACTAAIGVLIQLYFYRGDLCVRPMDDDDDEIIGERAANP